MAALVAVLGSSSECDVEDIGKGWYGGGTQGCEINPDEPHVSTHAQHKHGKRYINAVAQVQCQVRLEAHSVHVSLQRRERVSGGWVTVRTVKEHDVPKPNGKVLRVKATWQECRPGTYRARAQAFSVYEGRQSQSPVRWSRDRKITRDECRKR